MGTHYGYRPTRNSPFVPPPTVIGLSVGEPSSSFALPTSIEPGDLLVVMHNGLSSTRSISGAASSWTQAFRTSGAGFGYEFTCWYGIYTSGSTVNINASSDYNAMCGAVRNASSVSSTFGMISNINSGATSTVSVAVNGVMFGMATDRGSSASQPGISGMTFQQNKLFGTTYFGCRAVLGQSYVQQTISVTDVNNTYGTQFCMGVVI